MARTAPVPPSAALHAEAVAELSRGVPDAAARISAHAADVADAAAVTAAVKAAAAAHGGRIDVVINSAGISGPRVFDDVGADEFEATYRINVVGSRNATFAALPFMRGAAGGRVVLVSSQAGQTGIFGYTAYSVRGARDVGCGEAHRRRRLFNVEGCARGRPLTSSSPVLPRH